MNKILLLGGTGFIGKSLVTKLVEKNSLKIMIHNFDFATSVEKFKGDVITKESFSDEIRNDETIVNLVGQITSNETDLVNTNIVGGLNLLNSCIEKKIKQIVLISSINVYGENLERPSKETDMLKPQTTYGLVKMISEQIYRHFSEKFGINVTILRLAGIYSSNKKTGFLSQIIRSTKDTTILPISYNQGMQQRDLLYIDDAIDGITRAINSQHDGFNIFNISSGKTYSIKNLVSIIEKITNTKIAIEYNSEIPDERCIWADNSKAKKFLNFEPKFDIESGLKLTINHFFNK